MSSSPAAAEEFLSSKRALRRLGSKPLLPFDGTGLPLLLLEPELLLPFDGNGLLLLEPELLLESPVPLEGGFATGNWTGGVPDGTKNACITLAGTYAVTVRGSAGAAGITLGGSSGQQTLQLVGDATNGSATLTLVSQGSASDVYYAAFMIPDLLFFLIAGGALSSAFIPVFTEKITHGKEEEAWHVFSTVATVMFTVREFV